MSKDLPVIPLERIQRAIYLIRGENDFMFQLTIEEAENLRCQTGISSSRYGGRRYRPHVFTEQGVAMLSSVLRSERAVLVNIAIMRAFVQLRQVLGSHAELARKLTELERAVEGHDTAIRSLFDAIRHLMEPSKTEQSAKEIGFHVKEDQVPYRIKRLYPRLGRRPRHA